MSLCPTCGAVFLVRAAPLLDGTPVLMCKGCGGVATVETWAKRALGVDAR